MSVTPKRIGQERLLICRKKDCPEIMVNVSIRERVMRSMRLVLGFWLGVGESRYGKTRGAALLPHMRELVQSAAREASHARSGTAFPRLIWAHECGRVGEWSLRPLAHHQQVFFLQE